jgi:hypothetical protein
MEAIHRAYINAICVFALDAVVGHNIGHEKSPSNQRAGVNIVLLENARIASIVICQAAKDARLPVTGIFC